MKYFFYASAVFFVFIGAAILFTLVKKDKLYQSPPARDYIPQERTTTPSFENQPVRIITPSDNDFTTIEYKNNGFFPAAVELRQNESGLGCLLKIINNSDRELLLRLSPYDPSDRRGFSFKAVEPGGSIKIDPRHGTSTVLLFHNRHRPADEFTVKLDKNCF
jgi:hypothetical protein